MSDIAQRAVAAAGEAARRKAEEEPVPEPLPPPGDVTLVYDKVTLHYADMELHAERLDERRWRLYATLNYITIHPVVWTYDETIEGTVDEVYAHAVNRLRELAELKPIHDAVHHRINEMSTGANGDNDDGSITPVVPDGPILLVGGHRTFDPRLDRVPQWDERNRRFPIRAVLADKEYKPRSYTWRVETHLNQGNEGACVGFAWAHELIARPKVVDRIDQPFARWIYKTAQRYDPWSGEAYEGTSVLAGAKVVQKQPPEMAEGRGLIDEYRWIFDVDEMVRTVGYFGPVILGVWWWSGMRQPDSDAFIHPTGSKLGGHAILAKGVNVKRRFFTLHNSWGEDWGDGGDCRIGFDDMAALLADQGEAVVPLGRRVLE